MTQPLNTKPGFPPSDEPQAGKDRHDTVLLSDVPEPSSLMNETGAAHVLLPNLSTGSLAALGQRYDILAEAGHGSMGNVYKARDRETGETVALKLLKPEIASDQAMMERFKNELLFARRITHKNVCRVHEFNRIGGIACTSMEFVEGESLRSVLNRFGGLPTRKAIGVAQQICSGLKEAHAQGIVHRDLKPENVMIDAQGNVKIMDFGIARSMEAGTRLSGSLVGTPAYMAPEQVAGKPVDYRTDIYSLGLMLYEMFTGVQAFQGDAAVAVALKQMNEAPRPPHEVEPSIPVGIERAILKCLEKDPSERFQSVVQLENVLRTSGDPAMPASAVAVTPTPIRPIETPIPVVIAAPIPKLKRTSAFAWVLLGAFVVLGAFSAMRWGAVMKAAKELAPPATPHAPKPPEFAFDIPAPQPTSPATPAATGAAESSKASGSATAKPSPTASSKRKANAESVPSRSEHTPGSRPAAQTAATGKADLPKEVPQRTAQAYGESASDMKAKGNAATYLWVGRFQREDRAKAAAKKIEDLGLPVHIVPKHGEGGDAYVLFAGPFGAKRVSSVMEWLKAQGFEGVHAVAGPAATQAQNH